MSILKDQVLAALTQCTLPSGGNLVSANLVRGLEIADGRVSLTIEVRSTDEAKALAPVRDAAERVVAALPGVAKVLVVLTANATAERPKADEPAALRQIPGVKRILAVASGKGGVGKSTISANLAVAMARQGWRVGLLDADIYGPSQPLMMGVNARPKSPDGKTIIPLEAHGIRMISIGLMLPEGEAIVWRGPMLMGALKQLLLDVHWGELDCLIVDLPPGTGDIQLTLCTHFDVTAALIVSTPQDMALIDARKAMVAFKELKTEVLGLIENMSHYLCPNCGHEDHIFGHGGVAREAESQGIALLAQIPLHRAVMAGGEDGKPIAHGEGAIAEIFGRLAARLIESAEAHEATSS